MYKYPDQLIPSAFKLNSLLPDLSLSCSPQSESDLLPCINLQLRQFRFMVVVDVVVVVAVVYVSPEIILSSLKIKSFLKGRSMRTHGGSGE